MAHRVGWAWTLHHRWARALAPHSEVMMGWALDLAVLWIGDRHSPDTAWLLPSSSVKWCLGGQQGSVNLSRSRTVSSNAIKMANWLNSTAYFMRGRSLEAREVNKAARGSMGKHGKQTKNTVPKNRNQKEGKHATKPFFFFVVDIWSLGIEPTTFAQRNALTQWFSIPVLEAPCSAHLACLPYLTHLIEIINKFSSWLSHLPSWWSQSGMLNKETCKMCRAVGPQDWNWEPLL